MPGFSFAHWCCANCLLTFTEHYVRGLGLWKYVGERRFAVQMSFLKELRLRARHVVGPVIGISAVTYFGYHVVHGDRGLMAWWQLSQRIEIAHVSLQEITYQRTALERRVRLLHPDSLDLDMLEERARIMLNYGHINDIVALDEKRRK